MIKNKYHKNKYRLYSFTANHYLSPLQCGLQTAHVVSNLSIENKFHPNSIEFHTYDQWAINDKTIIILGAGNHKGVFDAFKSIQEVSKTLALPHVIFREDEESMNCMATACGVIVPDSLYNATYVYPTMAYANATIEHQSAKPFTLNPQIDGYYKFENIYGKITEYTVNSPEGKFIKFLKSFRFA